jgi:hypothetical protein
VSRVASDVEITGLLLFFVVALILQVEGMSGRARTTSFADGGLCGGGMSGSRQQLTNSSGTSVSGVRISSGKSSCQNITVNMLGFSVFQS